MRARSGRADPGFYPEREAGREAPLDRLFGEIGFGLHSLLRRDLRLSAALDAEVARHAARFRVLALAEQARELRYRLRRDGLEGERLAECFGLYAAALPPGGALPAGAALAAAAALVRGGIVDLADAQGRWQALALAATAFALCGVPVHLYAASEARARAAAAALGAPLQALGASAVCVDAGMSAAERRVAYGAPVVCGTQRVIAYDYLRDRIQLGRRLRPMQRRLERLSGDTTVSGAQLLLSGLHCALVEDAEQVLLDDAHAPMVISADAASSPDRLPYEQALELARGLEANTDYTLGAQGGQLTAPGAQRLAQHSAPLGGLWAARHRREELVCAALTALHAMEHGRDYEVQQGVLRLASSGTEEAPAPAEALQRLLEVKERLAFAGRRDVLARLSAPRFFRRYLRLAGICGDARGLEKEFWSLYGLRATRAGAPAARFACTARMFVSPDQRRSALAASVRARAAGGQSVVVALRSDAEAGAVADALRQAGVQFASLRPAAQGSGREALAALDRPGSVMLSQHPAQRAAARTAGGAPLHLAVAELHDARRQVAQIAQAYAADSCEQFLAVEDAALASLIGGAARGARAAAGAGGELPAAPAGRIAALAQRAAERSAARTRREMMLRERQLEDSLAFSGHPE
jgi:preprotein translocase subunit SecA